MQNPKRRERPSPSDDAEAQSSWLGNLLDDFRWYIAFSILVELIIPAFLNHFFGIGFTAGTFIALAVIMVVLGVLCVCEFRDSD